MEEQYRLVYFLGAGAARPCGYLTTPELYRSLVGERPNLSLLNRFGGLLNEISKNSPWDLETLFTMTGSNAERALNAIFAQLKPTAPEERLVAALMMQETQLREAARDLQKAFEEARPAILEFLIEKFWLVEPDLRPYRELRLGDSCQRLGFENVCVFTTNYDTSLEDSLKGITPFTTGVEEDEFTPTALSARQNEKLRIVKLHGSLDLHVTRDNRVVRIPYPARAGQWRGGQQIARTFLVPPDAGKVHYDPDQESLIRLLQDEVGRANALAIIGSSLRDNRLSEVLTSASVDCEILVACGSRSADLARSRFTRHGRITIVETHFPCKAINDWLLGRIHYRGKPPPSE